MAHSFFRVFGAYQGDVFLCEQDLKATYIIFLNRMYVSKFMENTHDKYIVFI